MTNLEDYIVEVPNAISNTLCDALINEYTNSDEWALGTICNKIDAYQRNCSLINMSSPATIQKNNEVRVKLDKDVYECVNNALSIYVNKFPDCNIQSDTGYHLLRYNTGEYIKRHTDAGHTQPRSVSCSLGLNNDYTGGEFYFPNLNKKIKLAKGSIFLFPSSFAYPHEILTVTSGTRYSIITWLF